MSAVIFAGPTIAHDEIAATLDCECLPPAAQGDIYRVARSRPRAIGIIDGYFHGVPSPWHKEILWAMHEGIHVFGSSSMGALRASELCVFGMCGVGRIFEDYRRGRLIDDDEVALLHGPMEAGFVPLSEPMVNIRATLERAVEEKIINVDTGEILGRIAKGLFYQKRTWEAMFENEAARALSPEATRALREWLPAGRFDLKWADAHAMLTAMKNFIASEPGPMEVSYDFQWTHLWDAVTTASIDDHPICSEDGIEISRAQLLDELRLDPEIYRSTRRDALLRLLAIQETSGDGIDAGPGSVAARKTAFRSRHGLFRRTDLDDWLSRNRIDDDGLDEIIADELRIESLLSHAGAELDECLLAELRSSGRFEALLDRARRKSRSLSAMSIMDTEVGAHEVPPTQLLLWFFEARLGRDVPANIDEVVRELGLESRQDLYRILNRERLYCEEEQAS